MKKLCSEATKNWELGGKKLVLNNLLWGKRWYRLKNIYLCGKAAFFDLILTISLFIKNKQGYIFSKVRILFPGVSTEGTYFLPQISFLKVLKRS